MMDFIEMLRTKPDHVRRRVAFVVAASFTGVIALAWSVALASSGKLALTPSNTGDLESAFSGSKSVAASVMTAASALTGGNSKTPAITVVKTSASSTLDKPAEETRTVIPF